MGVMIEHFAGAFPVRLAPTQVAILPISDAFAPYVHTVQQALVDKHLRVIVDDSSESLNKKIRNAELMKIPYMLIIGEKEMADLTVSVRVYKTKEQYTLSLGEFANKVLREYKERIL